MVVIGSWTEREVATESTNSLYKYACMNWTTCLTVFVDAHILQTACGTRLLHIHHDTVESRACAILEMSADSSTHKCFYTKTICSLWKHGTTESMGA